MQRAALSSWTTKGPAGSDPPSADQRTGGADGPASYSLRGTVRICGPAAARQDAAVSFFLRTADAVARTVRGRRTGGTNG
jgi:hypothetical protein